MHDGFTLADLVSYERKHNEANGEENRDGSDENDSTNCGVEGPTDDPQIVELRRQLRRNLLSCLMLAQGVPLLLAGDEVGNSQGGNNNAYCQDNETGWVDWSGLGRDGEDMTLLIAQLTRLRLRFPQLRARRFVDGRRADGSFGVLWLTPRATEMTEQDWNFPDGRFLSYVLGPWRKAQSPLYVVLNAAPDAIDFKLPMLPEYSHWTVVLNTADALANDPGIRLRRQVACSGALGPCVRGGGMNAEMQLRTEAECGWRDVSPVGAGGQACRARCSIVPMPCSRSPDGWYELAMAGAGAGTRYKFRIDGEIEVPDPASHFQPQDVSGPSEVVDHEQFAWRARDWRGRPWEDAALLELHVGTFTPGGSFRSAIERLDHVVDTGLTAIELMPLADFSGRRNWGYDGVLLYAPDSAYGRPDDLKALIDAAHLRGLMVFLDVVYNHFGPEGNYLSRYAPAFFDAAHTPWGRAIDYRVPQVRDFAVGNALHWLQHYRFDGLRLDAVQAIVETGRPPILEELSRAVGELSARSGRMIHLVLENDDNRASLLDPRTNPPQGRYRAQWNDDYHHAWHVLLTGERKGYYQDYACAPAQHIARVLASGFAYQGEVSAHRNGRRRGEPSGALAADGVRQFSAEPRPDRQPAVRRSPLHASRRGGARGRYCRHACSPRCRR